LDAATPRSKNRHIKISANDRTKPLIEVPQNFGALEDFPTSALQN